MNSNTDTPISEVNEAESNQDISATNSSTNSDGAFGAESGGKAEETADADFSSFISSPFLLERIRNLGFEKSFPVQSQAIPPALEGRDLIIQAKTGSGKTLAFVLPLLEHLKNHLASDGRLATFGLVVVPTRELANQISQVVEALTPEYKPVNVIGGESFEGQIQGLRDKPYIVVGTPGRIIDLIRKKTLKLHTCRYFVLDEADEMLSVGFLEDIRGILSRLPDKRQGIFVSATITPRVEMLASSFLTKPLSILLKTTGTDQPTIEHWYCEVGGDILAKPGALCDIIETQRPRSSIIFCNTKSDTELVEALLRRRGFDARRINSDLTQAQRTRIMNAIKNQELQFLVATDIAARGIDISEIELVVNYSIHEQPEIYVHRTGRTGRAGALGRAISLVGPKDFGSFHYLTKVLDIRFQKFPPPSDKEVCDARLAHLYELIRQAQIEPKERDMILGRKLLEELGEITSPVEELEVMIGKLTRFTIEHFIQIEAKSLEEEAQDEPRSTEGPRRDDYRREGPRRDDYRRDHYRRDDNRRDESRGNDSRREGNRRGEQRGNDYRREGQGGQRERGGSEDRGRAESGNRERPQRRHDERHEARAERPAQHGAERPPQRREPSHHRDAGPRRERPRGGRRDETGRHESDGEELREHRLFIGQGHVQGMTHELFIDLAAEFAGLKRQDLRNLSIREHYGYVDLDEAKARSLVKNLNGIEYNGMPLPVELATVINQRRQSSQT